MESIFSAAAPAGATGKVVNRPFASSVASSGGGRRQPYYWTLVLTEVVRPLGALTVVVQPLKMARIRHAPMVERNIVRISVRKLFHLIFAW